MSDRMTECSLGASPITTPVPGSPVQVGERVTVVASVEAPETDVDVSAFIGASGTVEYLEYACGCGQTFPSDPMIGVLFGDGRREEFWREELTLTLG